MAYVVLPTKAKNDALGFQHANNIKTDLDYLKTQSEVVVAENAAVLKEDIVPEATLKISNAPVEGAVLVARAAATGAMTWEGLWENPDFIAFT